MREKKIVQGAYISKEAKAAINKEAKKLGVFPGSLVAQILEKVAKQFTRKDMRYGENTKTDIEN